MGQMAAARILDGNVQLHSMQSTKESKNFHLHIQPRPDQRGARPDDSFSIFFTRSMKVARFFCLPFIFNPFYKLAAFFFCSIHQAACVQLRENHLEMCNCTSKGSDHVVRVSLSTSWFGADAFCFLRVITARSNYTIPNNIFHSLNGFEENERSHQTFGFSVYLLVSSAFPFCINLWTAQMLSFPTSFPFLFEAAQRKKAQMQLRIS